MENWRAGLIGVGIVLIGIGGYSSLDGVWKGLSLVAAGIALVLLGLSLERRPRPAVAAATAGEGSAEPPVDDLGATAPMTAVAVEEAETTAPILRTEPQPAPAPEPEPEPEPEPGPQPEPEPEPEPAMAEEAPPPLSEMAEVQGVAVSANGPVPSDLGDERAHEHDQPMLGHSELVSHIRDYHEGVPFDGSTIQLRLLHEREHA